MFERDEPLPKVGTETNRRKSIHSVPLSLSAMSISTGLCTYNDRVDVVPMLTEMEVIN